MKKLIAAIIVIAVIGLGFLVTQRAGPKTSNRLQVETSIYPLYYFTTQIAGDKAEVTNITPAGAEPHDYDPSAGDIAKIEKGNLFIINGVIEAWGDKIKANLRGTNVQVVTAGQGLFTRQIQEDGQNQIDPHVWLDPVLAKQEAHAIAEGLIKIDPANTQYYQQNEKALDLKLDALDAAYKTGLASCQENNIITSHAAFGYLASRYGLTQVTVTGLSPDAEPSAQQLANVVAFARLHKVTYIFFEKLISPKLSETVATEVGAKTLVLDPIEGVSEADMKAGKNYYTIMLDNLKNLQTALLCKT